MSISRYDLYGVIISLQEASRWLESGFLDNAKFDLELALNELQKITAREEQKANQSPKDNNAPSSTRL
jgi:hypothetical protein